MATGERVRALWGYVGGSLRGLARPWSVIATWDSGTGLVSLCHCTRFMRKLVVLGGVVCIPCMLSVFGALWATAGHPIWSQ